jgi:transcriptional regulator with XRE-family HTH domain
MSLPLHPVLVQLRQLRQATGLSLLKLEEKHGITAGVVGSWERGDRRPTVDALQRVLDVYGYDLVAVPRHRVPGGAPVVRTAADMTTLLRKSAEALQMIADQLDPEELPLPAPDAEPEG